MKVVRQKYVAKPVLLHQIVYSHKEQASNSSEASFLLLSHNSKEVPAEDSQLFHSMQAGISALQQHSLNQLNQVHTSIQALTKHRNRPKPYFMGSEEGKENLFSGFKIAPKLCLADEQPQGTFQIDQNRNYIQCSPPLASKGSKTISIQQHNTREFHSSLSNSKVQPSGNKVTARKNSCSLYSERLVDVLRKDNLVGPNTKRSCSAVTRRRSIQSGVSLEATSRKGGVYESILSQYSTRKLISMEGRK